MTEPVPTGLRLIHEHGLSVRVHFGAQELLRYVYQPWDAQLESPRPYFHPLRTIGGELVSLYRPHDHVWHKGLAWSVANVGDGASPDRRQQNFWGGPTFLTGAGYRQLDNDGSMRHRGFTRLDATQERVDVAHDLDWVTQDGRTWIDERRRFSVSADASAWTLAFATSLANVAGHDLVLGSPTTQGRENAGYGGLFWRGPRSFSGGTVYVAGQSGGDELMGTRAPWLAFAGSHDGHDGSSTLVFVDDPGNPGHPVRWFVRSGVYACVCPAPFFSDEVVISPGETLTLRYAITVADGDAGPDGSAELAKRGLAELNAARG